MSNLAGLPARTHKMCQRHPSQRANRCSECWQSLQNLERRADFAWIYSGLCPHGRRKERCTACGHPEKRAQCHHGTRKDRCGICKTVTKLVQDAVTKISPLES